MKKGLIAFATLQAVAALAAASTRSPNAENMVLKPTAGGQTNEIKLNLGGDKTATHQENDDALCLKPKVISGKPTFSRPSDRRPIHNRDPVSIIKRSGGGNDEKFGIPGIACTDHLDRHIPDWMVSTSRRTMNVAARA